MLLLLFSASLHVKLLYGKTINVIVRNWWSGAMTTPPAPLYTYLSIVDGY